MRQPKFEKMVTKLYKKLATLRSTKGKEYTQGSKDVLDNFKRIAKESGLSPLQVWFTYYSKHGDSIASYIKFGQKVKSSESIEGRFEDALNYLLLGYALIRETKKKSK